MSSSWASSDPKSKVVDTHYRVGHFYGFLGAIAAFGLLATFKSGISYPHLALFALASAMSFAHFKASEAAESDKEWVPVASMALAIPLLLAFPIGTYLGIKLLTNAAQLKLGNA